MDMSLLEKIGLSKAEIKVYLTLLKIGSSSTGIITKQIGLRKSTIYDCLNRLSEKGLVSSVITNNVKQFQAVDPERLTEFVEEKKRNLAEYESKLKILIPQLKGMEGFEKPTAEAHVLQGKEGFKTMRRDVLKSGAKELLMLGAISREDKVMPVFFHQWEKERVKLRICMRILHKKKVIDKIFKKIELTEVRFLPQEINNPVVINIYADRVVSILWQDKEPVCFLIKNKTMAAAYKNYFDVLWKQSK